MMVSYALDIWIPLKIIKTRMIIVLAIYCYDGMNLSNKTIVVLW